MARDGSGTYSLAATMAVANQQASSTTVNSVMNDIAQALTDSINKDGTKAFAANQSMGSNKITSLAAGTALTDAAQLSQVQKGNVSQATTVGGTVDAITLNFTPAITSYTSGMCIRWVSGGANTVTTPTLNIDSLGTKTVKKNPGGAALAAGDLGISGTVHEAVYNGTDFILLNPGSSAPNTFSTIAVSGQSNVVADSSSDTLTLAAGTNITITTNATTDTVTITASGGSTPAGAVMPYAGSTEPSGWLFCYGQAVSRATYADLFTAISTTYGVGDGSTTFNLPDLRGRVVAGQDDMGGVSANRLTNQTNGIEGDTLGATGGAETHTLTDAQMPSHTHTVYTNTAASTGAVDSIYVSGLSVDASGAGAANADTSSAGSDGAHNNVQPTIILNYIIKT